MHELRYAYTITIGELGAAAAQTAMIALLPVLLSPYTNSATVIGLVVGGEGAFALIVPALVGRYSDTLPRRLVVRFGRRTLFLGAGAPLMCVALIAIPFVHSFWLLATTSFVFFVALHTYLTPLWTLLIDQVDPESWGRVQGARGFWRTGGLAYGLIAGGVFFDAWPPLPFLVAAALVLATTWINTRTARSHEFMPAAPQPKPQSLRTTLQSLRDNHAGRWTLIANALWSGAIDGIRPFIFLYAIGVFAVSMTQVSMGLVVLVVTLALGSVVLGALSDRYSRSQLMLVTTLIGGVAMSSGLIVRDAWLILAILVVAGLAMSSIIAIGYPLFASFVGQKAPGIYTGLFVMSTGLGRIVAPVLVGAAIDVGKLIYPAERGLPMMWAVAGLLMMAGTAALQHGVREHERVR